MTFKQSVMPMLNGKQVRRRGSAENLYYDKKNNKVMVWSATDERVYELDDGLIFLTDMAATDWEVVTE